MVAPSSEPLVDESAAAGRQTSLINSTEETKKETPLATIEEEKKETPKKIEPDYTTQAELDAFEASVQI